MNKRQRKKAVEGFRKGIVKVCWHQKGTRCYGLINTTGYASWNDFGNAIDKIGPREQHEMKG